MEDRWRKIAALLMPENFCLYQTGRWPLYATTMACMFQVPNWLSRMMLGSGCFVLLAYRESSPISPHSTGKDIGI